MPDFKETIKNSLFFGGMSPDLTARMEKTAKPESYGRDEMIFFEGDRGEKFFFVSEGLVKIYKSTESAREVVLRHIRPGEMFGEVILFESANYPVNAVAMRDTALYSIRREMFLKMLEDDEFVRYFTGNLFRKMRYLADRVAFLNAYDVEERFFFFVDEHFGLKPMITTDLSKAELAEAIGTIPETMSRLLARLKLKDLVTWNRDELKLDVDYARSVVERVRAE
ncbi:MAG TPA: Crp/Fnr family transcriptional regulator [Spirochaetota bacterium]|nr:Crp/Fnr family transcriptional regulator [Spirochaetota bacterium]